MASYRRISLTVITAMIILCGISQAGAEGNTRIKANWRKGEEKRILIRKLPGDQSGSPEKPSSMSIFKVILSVRDSNDKGYTLHWLYKQVIIPEETQKDAFYRNLEGFTVEYKTDPDGRFLEIVNWESLRDHALLVLDGMTNGPDVDVQARYAASQLKKLFSNRSTIENEFIRDIRIFHEAYGLNLDTATTVKSPVMITTVVPGKPIPGIQEKTLHGPAKEGGPYKLTLTNIMNGKEGTLIFYEETSQLTGKKIPEGTALPSLEYIESIEYEIDMLTGWSHSISQNQTIEIKGVKHKGGAYFFKVY